MRALFIGGGKSGKSTAAQKLAAALADGGPLYYWATMTPHDGEDEARIQRHRDDRAGMGFTTVERSFSLPKGLTAIDPAGAVLFDSVTACLSEQMFPCVSMTPFPLPVVPEVKKMEESLSLSIS